MLKPLFDLLRNAASHSAKARPAHAARKALSFELRSLLLSPLVSKTAAC